MLGSFAVLMLIFLQGTRDCLNDWIQCGPGHALPHPTYVNLYWDPMWNTTVGRGSFLRTSVLDDFTRALVNSDYFNASEEYGAGRASFVGGFISPSACGAAPSAVHITDIPFFIDCVKAHNVVPQVNGPLIYNVFLPAATIADGGRLPYDGTYLEFNACGHLSTSPPQGAPAIGGWTAYHYFSSDVYTLIPANPSCNADLAAITTSLSHEMIEAATDPHFPDGWIHHYGDPIRDATLGEVADDCEPGGRHQLAVAALNFLMDAQAAPYWADHGGNDNRGSCVGPFAPTPSISDVRFSGADSNLRITVSGSNFGSLGPGFDLPATRNLPYFHIVDSTASVTAGNSVSGGGGDTTTLKYESWSDNTIVVSGATSSLPIMLGDSISVTVVNPQSGTAVMQSITFPRPASINLTLPPFGLGFPVNQPVDISAGVLDTSGNPPALPVLVGLSHPAGTGGLPIQVTVPAGTGITHFTFTPARSGLDTITATVNATVSKSINVPVVPLITSVQPDHGREQGGSRVKILGTGLIGMLDAKFGDTSGLQIQAVSDNELRVITPRGKGSITVPVTVTAPGQISIDDGQTFTYFTPFIPLINAWGNIADCLHKTVDAQVFDANDLPLAGRPLYFATTAGHLSASTVRTNSDGAAQVVLTGESGQSATVSVHLPRQNSATIEVNFPSQCAAPFRNGHIRITTGNVPVLVLPGCDACKLADVPANYWAKPYIDELIALKVLKPSADKRFHPNAQVSGYEFMSALQQITGTSSQTQLARKMFDVEMNAGPISAREAISVVSKSLRLNSQDSKAFSSAHASKGNMTRAGMAEMLARVAARMTK